MADAASPMALTVQQDGTQAVLLLSDGRSISRLAHAAFDLPALHALSAAAVAGAPEAGAALWRALFPDPVGAFLRGAAPRPLVLQLPPALDALAWELAAPDGAPLATRWGLSRQLQFDDETPHAVGAAALQGGALRVLGVGLELGADTPPRGVLRHLATAQWTAAAAPNLLATHDVVLLAAEAAGQLAALWPALGTRRPPPLVVLCDVGAETRLACARELDQSGCALLCVDAPAAGFVDALLGQLLGGASVADAVRALRVAAARPLLLYGPAHNALCAPPEAAVPAASLRQVSSLSFDLVDSTALLQRLGEERYSELLSAFHAECAAIVQRHGGLPDDPQGDDGTMNYFGYPEADENAAEHAVAAGLEIAQAVRRLEVSVRIGIATGRVAVRAGMPVGISIHLAARLQSAATPGSVLVADTTRALVGHRFELEPLAQPLTLKGIPGAALAFRVLRRIARDDAVAPDAIPHQTPFVGREAELALLMQQWELAQQGQARTVLVSGEGGIGKSRLVAQFRAWLTRRELPSLECRGHADTRHSAFVALAETLRRLLQLQPDDDAETQRDKIARGLPPGIATDDAVPLIASLLAIEGAAAATASDNPQRQRERTLALLLDWVRRAVQARPLCLIVEDTHWLDPSTREFLTRLLAEPAGLPLLVLTTQRSDADASWRPPSIDETLALRGLAPMTARWLARQACGERQLPQDVLRLLAARSDGVPLFLEESVLMALELGPDRARSPQALRLDVPSTLQDLLMARLDRLGAARPVAQLGAVLGREFPEALLRAVLAHGNAAQALDLTMSLRTLERSGLLLRSGDAAEPAWAFKHALVRDIAYQSLWERDRQRVHREVAEVLAEQFTALVGRQPELLARHQTEAGLDAQALAQWELAARRAAAASAHEESIGHLENALRLLQRRPEGRERDRAELRLLLLLASRYIATEGYGADRIGRLYARAAELCEVLGDTSVLLKVGLGQHGWHFMRGELVRAHEIAQRSVAMAEQSTDTMQRLQASWSLAITQFHRGDSIPAVRRMDDCLAAYRPELHHPAAVQDPGVMCLCYSAWAQWELGHVDDALVRVRRVIDLAHRLDHKFSLGEAYGFATSVHLFRGETEAGLECAERSIAICEEGGFTVWLAHALVMRGRLRCDLGEFETGLADMHEGCTLWIASGAAVTLPMYSALRAEGLALAGRVDEGLGLLDQALAAIERTGECYHEAEVRRLIGALRWQRAGQRGDDAAADAEAWMRDALALAQAQHKHSFALRAANTLARLWSTRGRAAQAVHLLEATLAGLPEAGDTHDRRYAKLMMREARETGTIGVLSDA